MIINNVKNYVVNLLLNEGATSPTYIAFGTATTASTRSDTGLYKEGTRVLKSDSGSYYGVSWVQGELDSLTGTGNTYTEVGTFDESSGGNLYEREVIGGLYHKGTANTRTTRFISVDPVNTNRVVITNIGRNQIADWFIGTSFTVPSHIGWGTNWILDSCGSLGTNPNDWKASTDAGTVQLDIGNYQEGTASIKLGKEGVTTTEFSYGKTLSTAVNGSNASQLRLWVNPKVSKDFDKLASSTALTILLGTDSNNYNFYYYDKGELFVGWKRLKIDIADMIGSGSPDMSNINYMRIIWKTEVAGTTITKGNILMDEWCLYKPIDETDTSLLDEKHRGTITTKQDLEDTARFKADVNTNVGNSYDYTNEGLFNALTSGDMFLENEHSRIRKNKNTKILQEATVKIGIKYE